MKQFAQGYKFHKQQNKEKYRKSDLKKTTHNYYVLLK